MDRHDYMVPTLSFDAIHLNLIDPPQLEVEPPSVTNWCDRLKGK